MAKLKFEFMREYYKSHRRPLRDYLFGYFHITARLLSAFAPLINWMMRLGWFKNIAARIFQITPHRPFPKFTWRRAHVVRIGNPHNQNLAGYHPAPQKMLFDLIPQQQSIPNQP